MPERLVQVKIPSDTGVARDSVVNNFAFKLVSDTPTNEALVMVAIADFYNLNNAGAGTSIANYLSPVLNTGSLQASMAMYDITGALGYDISLADEDHPNGKIPPHGSPVNSHLWTLGTPAGADPMPSECAFALTLETIDWDEQPVEGPGNTRPRSRYRGRLFLGPFNENANENNVGVSRPGGDMRDQILIAANRLADAIVAIDPLGYWGVWSRARGVVGKIESVSSANDWDTMRSRGERASVRTRVAVQ